MKTDSTRLANFGNVKPLYYTILRTIEQEYKDQPPGTLIPSETQLMKRFDASRGTVQRAVTELCREGFLYRIQGKGTYVATPRIERQAHNLLSFTEEIKNHGYRTSADILRFEVITPKSVVRNSLQLDKGDKVYLIERVRFIEDQPMAYVLSYVPEKLAHGLTLEDVEDSVYRALENAGYKPIKAKDTFRARIVDDVIARLLDCELGDASFFTKRIAYAEDNIPVEYVEGVIRGADYALTIEPSRADQNSKVYFHTDLLD